MKVWQCLTIVGLSMGFTLAEAQETSAPEQQEQQQEATPEQAPPAAEPANDAQDAKQQQQAQQPPPEPEPRQDWTPEALFEHVTEQARQLADKPYKAPQSPLPESVANLGYNDYRNIRFRQENALWRGERLFEVQFFHPGFLYDQPIDIHVLKDGRVEELRFDPNMFRYGDGTASVHDALANIDPAKLGFAGFRLHYPLNTPDYKDEFVVFLGASYFRMVGRGQNYGMSARGLAVDTATPDGEEFPSFRAYWLVRPEPNATQMTLFALLDSPSVTGAYRFVVHAGNNVVMDVEARLFARNNVGKLGVAPLTSMFLHGENSVGDWDDFRPEVHDSDGLLMHTSGDQWIRRPLSNPPALSVTQLRDEGPRGFGLMQRDRDFEHYLDAQADYHQRPSFWVDPVEGDWGKGGLELVEIPTESEIHDNIVAYWVPDTPLRAGESRRYVYRLSTHGEPLAEHRLGRVVRTRSGWGATAGESDSPGPDALRQFVVGFKGGALAGLHPTQPVQATLNTSTGKITDVKVFKLPDGKTWRASFKLAPQDGQLADMQLRLMLRGEALTETWSYIWNPDAL
ncbi:glucans biosynthesis protein [Modicisalibacter muralis]|uniref:Glucans biosynthesis protein n=1 Tax=Modicisalibacter muralis TaxID=119000 RepID=A0A1G9IA41_9GAMM|nr:glucan biosynthesis protein G [Halomonas muralis]SDL22120.1 glucans biosynthesis protein [Halomonas muralis]